MGASFEDVSIVGADLGIRQGVFVSDMLRERYLDHGNAIAGIVNLDSVVRGLAAALANGKRDYWCQLHDARGGRPLVWVRAQLGTLQTGSAWLVMLAEEWKLS